MTGASSSGWPPCAVCGRLRGDAPLEERVALAMWRARASYPSFGASATDHRPPPHVSAIASTGKSCFMQVHFLSVEDLSSLNSTAFSMVMSLSVALNLSNLFKARRLTEPRHKCHNIVQQTCASGCNALGSLGPKAVTSGRARGARQGLVS